MIKKKRLLEVNKELIKEKEELRDELRDCRIKARKDESFAMWVGGFFGVIVGIVVIGAILLAQDVITSYDPYDPVNDQFCRNLGMEYEEWGQKCIKYTKIMEKIEFNIKDDDGLLYLKRRI